MNRWPAHYCSPPSTVVDAVYHTMEEVNELARAIGREGEYRQLSKGRVTSRWRSLHLGQFAVTSHRWDKRLHARLTPPRGCVSLAIMPPPYFMLVDGVEVWERQGARSRRELGSGYRYPVQECLQYACPPRVRFQGERTSALSPVPDAHERRANPHVAVPPSSAWPALHGEVRDLLRNGGVSAEDLSHLLSRFLDLMAGEPEKRQREVCLGTRSTGSVARRAQEYIEDHYSVTIRMEDLCRRTGVSARVVQRSFSEYFQLSPFAYIKARRLNAARQALVAGDSSRDSVTLIAMANGFGHLGRFAVDYREHFDESPKETLVRQARSWTKR